MSPRIARIAWSTATLVTFVQLFSTVYFQMSPQSTYIRGCIITLIAFFFTFLESVFSNVSSNGLYKKMQSHINTFVWLCSTVCFQMSPQITCTKRSITTLVALIWLFSTGYYQMVPQSACIRGEDVKSHWLHLFDYSLMCVLTWCLKSMAFCFGVAGTLRVGEIDTPQNHFLNYRPINDQWRAVLV